MITTPVYYFIKSPKESVIEAVELIFSRDTFLTLDKAKDHFNHYHKGTQSKIYRVTQAYSRTISNGLLFTMSAEPVE